MSGTVSRKIILSGVLRKKIYTPVPQRLPPLGPADQFSLCLY